MKHKLHLNVEYPREMAYFLADIFDINCQSTSAQQDSYAFALDGVSFVLHQTKPGQSRTQGVVIEVSYSLFLDGADENEQMKETLLDQLHKKIEFILYSKRSEYPADFIKLHLDQKYGLKGPKPSRLSLILGDHLIFLFA